DLAGLVRATVTADAVLLEDRHDVVLVADLVGHLVHGDGLARGGPRFGGASLERERDAGGKDHHRKELAARVTHHLSPVLRRGGLAVLDWTSRPDQEPDRGVILPTSTDFVTCAVLLQGPCRAGSRASGRPIGRAVAGSTRSGGGTEGARATTGAGAKRHPQGTRPVPGGRPPPASACARREA